MGGEEYQTVGNNIHPWWPGLLVNKGVKVDIVFQDPGGPGDW